MAIRTTTFLCAAFLLSSCKEKNSLTATGIVGTMGPTLGPDGKVLANIVTFEYQLEAPRQVQFWEKGKQIKSVEIDGKGRWRIEVAGNKLKISDDALIFELPVQQDGLLASKSSINDAGHRGWDISIDGDNVLRLQPNPSIGTPQKE